MSIVLDENSFRFRGRLGDNPETKVTGSGKTVTTLSIATSWSKQVGTKDGKPVYEDQTDWHRVVAFGRDAEIIHANARKGDLFQCSGRISPRSYLDKDEIRRYTTDYVILNVEVMTWRKREQQAVQPQGNVDRAQGGNGGTPARTPTEEAPPPEFNPDDMPG